MQQVNDFVEECELLVALLKDIPEVDYEQNTLFKNWSINDILVHLFFWNRAADMALVSPEDFTALYVDLQENLRKGSLREFENAFVAERGRQLLGQFSAQYRDMGKRWLKAEPKQRVKWAGPDMSVRSSISARQMEVWAHGQAAFDLFGKEREETDRIKNIVFLGVNAFGWNHKVHGLEIPDKMPRLELEAPSGQIWEFGDDNENSIRGSAIEFCQVVTQTRNIADTALTVTGEVATNWMANAQCFAGPPETPPEPGRRLGK